MAVMVVLKCDSGSKAATVLCVECGRISRQILKAGYTNGSMSEFLRPHTCPVCGTTHQLCRAPKEDKWSAAFARYNINADAYNTSVREDYAQRKNRKPDVQPADEGKRTINDLGSVLRQVADVKKTEPASKQKPAEPTKPIQSVIEQKHVVPEKPSSESLPEPIDLKSAVPKSHAVPTDSTTAAIDHKIEHWKKELLDTSKRNKMINYRETKRATLRILEPGAEELFNKLAFSEKALTFQRPISKDSDFRTYAMLSLLETLNYNLPVHVGDIKADGTIVEREKTLKNLRAKTKLAQEEQGTNILYLSFGFILWREHNRDSSPWLKAPVLMMPVQLGMKSLNAPYTLSRYDDEIEVNPTLDYLFNAEYGIDLPTFELKNRNSFNDYMDAIEEIVDKRGWRLVREVSLGLLSFLKISMYHDLNNNREKILSNPVLQAISGDRAALGELPAEAVDFHFDESNPLQWHEVVDSDSSQEEAILLSKLGVSFVMQGPPGTGKSQTITNIIAEALADGKKVLFVSEKAAALQVVLKRLTEVNLDDFCLSLHNYKANKKEIIDNIGANLNLPQVYTKQSVLNELTELFYDRKFLDEYASDLHKVIEPLGDSIYIVYGKLSKLETASVVEFSIDKPTEISREQYASILYCVSAFEKALHSLEGPLSSNPWFNTTATSSGQTFKSELLAKTGCLDEQLDEIGTGINDFNAAWHTTIPMSWTGADSGLNRVKDALALPLYPCSWRDPSTIQQVLRTAENEQKKQIEYSKALAENQEYFDDTILDSAVESWVPATKQSKERIAQLGFVHTQTPIADAIQNTTAVEGLLSLLSNLSEQYTQVNSYVGLPNVDTLPNAVKLYSVVSLLKTAPNLMQKEWFDGPNNAQAARLAGEAAMHAKELSSRHESIDSSWHESILDLEASEIRDHFCAEYSWIYGKQDGNSVEDSLERALEHAKLQAESVRSLIDDHDKASELLSLKPHHTLQHMTMVSSILKLIEGVSYLETPWFDMRKNEEYLTIANEAKDHSRKISELTDSVLMDWEPSALNIDADAMLARFKTEYVGLFYKLKGTYKEDMKTVRLLFKHVGMQIDEDSVVKFLQTIIEINREKSWFADNAGKLTSAFGEQNKGVDTDWDKLHDSIVCAFKIAHQFPYANIPVETIEAIQRIIASIQLSGNARQLADAVSIDRIGSLGSELADLPYVEPIDDATSFSEHVLPQLEKFIDDCHIQGKYISRIAAAAKQSAVEYEDIMELLEDVSVVKEENSWFEENRGELSRLLNCAYSGPSSDWESIQAGISIASAVIALFADDKVPDLLRDSALNGSIATNQFASCEALSEAAITAIRDRLSVIAPHVDQNTDPVSSNIIPSLNEYSREGNELAAICKLVSSYVKNDCDSDTIVTLLPGVLDLKQQRERISSEAAELTKVFGERYAGLDTEWTEVITDIRKIQEFFKVEDSVVSDAFVAAYSNDVDCRNQLIAALDSLNSRYRTADGGVTYFTGLFPNSKLECIPVQDLADRYRACLNGFGELNKWLDYVETKAECDKLGLTSFTDEIARLDNSVKDVTAAFEKGFYTQWISLAINDVPAVQTFRRRVHEQHLEKFGTLDRKQFALSRDRIREKIIKTFPRTNQVARAGDELGILRHEMEKQRRIMPLRKLFQKIPKLLLTLKPCLMMSPLSVAYFLEAGSYEFDMVIFDEASQIFPQDAIGAIFRAKQVVIAGDTKQLPPTNFFSASTSNASQDFDDLSDDYEDELYDSILEETANVLPNRTLLWHYRSKHEHLIAFSNQFIYRNELVTFPSSNESEPDTGVEFVYVEDGYYEGGGRNCNIPEAKRCVALIREHIERHPERSLGIIAFSEKQQQAISLEVQRFREQNPQYEEFFAEGKEDEFFIKNLENVQGDERDTIFFSIGYAKTKEQKLNGRPMAMRFGPLGVQGGERRLNVAITRAKTNVKLISSIMPSDIDLSRTESEGIKMLRSYIEFAKNGVATLSATQTMARTDDFADTICELIKQRGYKVRQYVGCSGYKIDIAIEHPEIANEFVAGIECDGFSYASAKTARDRDRLRSSVLSNMGWNLYRVWSTEWYKNPEVESQKLFAFIDSAIAIRNEHLKKVAEQKRAIEEEKARAIEKAKAAKEREERRRQLEEEKRLEESRKKAEQARQARLQEKERLERERRAQEEARRAQTAKAREVQRPKVDVSWVKPGVKVAHKSFGTGTIKEITGTLVFVTFEAGDKKFSYPASFEQGFLSRADSKSEKRQVPTPALAPTPTRPATSNNSALLNRLVSAGFTCIDNRGTSSILWVLYVAEKKTEFESIISGFNVQCKLEKRGALATNNRAAWRIMY